MKTPDFSLKQGFLGHKAVIIDLSQLEYLFIKKNSSACQLRSCFCVDVAVFKISLSNHEGV